MNLVTRVGHYFISNPVMTDSAGILNSGKKIEGEGVNYLHFKVANISTVQTAFDALVDAISDSSDVQQKSAKLAPALLLSLLSRNTQTLKTSEYPNKVNAIVADTLSLIENSRRNASINAIALKYGVVESYISRLMRNRFLRVNGDM